MTPRGSRHLVLLAAACAAFAACTANGDTPAAPATPTPAVEIYRAELAGRDLHLAGLAGAVLRRADLTAADATGADFSAAILIAATFRDAELAGATFDGADLRQADFTGANVAGARFEGARWGDTLCPDGVSSRLYLGVCPMESFGARP
ncbi:MAG: pentapeptide repeat-containing protein [Dehalococcoidia bacterium]|nr:pentapeptide repeat-containing protein [Dehalococcoidia bacterium]